MANIPLQSITFPGLSDKYTTPTVDATLTQTGAAADAKKTGDEIGAIKNDFTDLSEKVDSAFVTETATGAVASFTDGADDVPVKDLSVAIEPVQSGSGDPSPENVRPISGWTGANITRVGKNLVNIPTCTIAQAGGVYPLSSLPQALPAGTYTAGITSSADAAWVVTFRDADNNIVGTIASNHGSTGRQTKTGTLSATAAQVSIYVNAGTTLSDIMFEFGSTASAYEPFVDSDTVSVDWTTEAGTVYGGTLDVTTGVLTVTHGVLNLVDLAWSGLDAKNRRYINMASVIKNHSDLSMVADIISDTYQTVANNTLYNDTSAIGIAQNDGFIFIRTPDNEVPSGVLVYPLLAPTTVQLTAQEVSTILGQNNIFADTGDSTVQYRADTKLYIDKVISA